MKKFSYGEPSAFQKKHKKGKIAFFEDGWKSIQLTPYPKDGSEENLEELNYLRKLMAKNTEEDLKKIGEQDSATKEFESNFAKIVKNPEEKQFVNKLAGDLFRVVIHFKEKYDRPRPWQMAEHFGIDYPEIFTETGQSPSFPSGHATGAFFLAEIMARKYPKFREKLFNYAEEVAENRMKGGVHYPSDIRAGKVLAKELLNFYKEPKRLSFKEWFA